MLNLPNNLLISEKKDVIKNFLSSKEKICLISGSTGSGKSTGVPMLLFDENLKSEITKERKAIMTLPRRIALTNIYNYLKPLLGFQIGYQMRFDKHNEKECNLLLMTDGYFLKSLGSKRKTEYSAIIIDEIHERSIATELLLGLLRSERVTYSKLILMSATMQLSILQDFFKNIFSINIISEKFPLEISYQKKDVLSLSKTCRDTIIELINKGKKIILVFLPGKDSIELLKRELKWKRQKSNDGAKVKNKIDKEFKVVKMHAGISKSKMEKIAKFSSGPSLVLLATNVAETSITIEGITDVVDCGLAKKKFYLPDTGRHVLKSIQISRQEAIQRAGRTGRTCPGAVHRLYTKAAFDSMAEQPPSQIVEGDPLDFLVPVFGIFGAPLDFPFLIRPRYDTMVLGIAGMLEKGLLQTNEDSLNNSNIKVVLSEKGRFVSKIPFPPELSLCLFELIIDIKKERSKEKIGELLNVCHVLLCCLVLLSCGVETNQAIQKARKKGKIEAYLSKDWLGQTEEIIPKGSFFECAAIMHAYLFSERKLVDKKLLMNGQALYLQIEKIIFKELAKLSGENRSLKREIALRGRKLVVKPEDSSKESRIVFMILFESCKKYLARGMSENICEIIGLNKLKCLKTNEIIFCSNTKVKNSSKTGLYTVCYNIFYEKRNFACFVEYMKESILLEETKYFRKDELH